MSRETGNMNIQQCRMNTVVPISTIDGRAVPGVGLHMSVSSADRGPGTNDGGDSRGLWSPRVGRPAGEVAPVVHCQEDGGWRRFNDARYL